MSVEQTVTLISAVLALERQQQCRSHQTQPQEERSHTPSNAIVADTANNTTLWKYDRGMIDLLSKQG